VRLLQQLAAASEMFIRRHLCCWLFGWKEWLGLKKQKNAENYFLKPALPLSHLILKLPKDDTLRTHELIELQHGDVFKLFNEIVNIAFQLVLEYSVYGSIQCLRKFNREVRNPRLAYPS
jgi:hypothetical protein